MATITPGQPAKDGAGGYILTVDTEESDKRLELLYTKVMKYGTIYNTVAASTELAGTIRRA